MSIKPENELKKKIKAINAIAYSKLGLDYELLHDMVYGLTRKTSIRNLTIKEANLVIASMLNKLEIKEKRNTTGNVRWLMSKKQRLYINSIAKKMLWGPEELDRFTQRQYQKPYNQLLVQEAQGLIEALKAILKRDFSSENPDE